VLVSNVRLIFTILNINISVGGNMRISIFNLNNKTSYKSEYLKIIKVLNSKCLSFKDKEYNYFEFINLHLFNNWKYRGTYLDLYEYLDFIGVNIKSHKINQDSFINFLEFLLNIQILIESIKYYNDNIIYNIKAKSILFHNIPIIIDELGYQAYDFDDKVLLYKKDITYTDLLDLVDDNIAELLLSYNNINNNGIKIKRIILNKIYDYLCLDINKYKSYNSSVFSVVKIIITKMGVSSDIDKKYALLSNYKLKKYYDYCFKLMCYLINSEYVYMMRDEIKNI